MGCKGLTAFIPSSSYFFSAFPFPATDPLASNFLAILLFVFLERTLFPYLFYRKLAMFQTSSIVIFLFSSGPDALPEAREVVY